MDKQTDYSVQLLEIGDIFASGLCLSGTDPHCIPDRLRSDIEVLRKATPTYLSLESIEVIVVAVLLHETCTGLSPGGQGTKVLDLIGHIFTHQTPLSNGLRIVKSLCDRDVTYARKYLGRPATTSFATFGKGSITDLFYDTVQLSERTTAWIMGDDLLMGYFGESPYSSNTEFLNDWSQAMSHALNSDDEWYCDHPYWNFIIGSEGVRRELDRISRRLKQTSVKIPFLDMISEFDLSLTEQLIMMYDLYKGHQEYSWSALNVNIFCKPNDTLGFVDRPPLTEESRLVQIGLFDRQESAKEGEAGTYHLSQKVRERIVAGADDIRKIPLV